MFSLLGVILLLASTDVATVPSRLDEHTQMVIRTADRVETFQVDPLEEVNYRIGLQEMPFPSLGLLGAHHIVRQGRDLTSAEARDVGELLIAENSYRPLGSSPKRCIFSPRHGFRFSGPDGAVDVTVCLQCAQLRVSAGGEHVGGGDFDPIQAELTPVFRTLFPESESPD